MGRETSPAVFKMLAYFANIYPSMDVTPGRVEAWDSVCGQYRQADLVRAAHWVAKVHHHGAPSPALIVEFIDGKVEKRQVPQTDHWNRKILRADGGYVTETMMVRVWPDGREQVEREALAPARHDGIGSGAALIGEGLDELLGGGE